MLDLETRFRVRLASYIDGSISLHELRAWIAAEITDESVER